MAVNHDYFCDCGHELRDIVADVKPKCAQCGVEMYGKYHPGFGEVVESYSHKQRLLKKYNCIEAADSVGGSKTHEYPEEYQGPDHGGKGYAPRKKRGLGDTEFIANMEDLKQLEKKHGFE